MGTDNVHPRREFKQTLHFVGNEFANRAVQGAALRGMRNLKPPRSLYAQRGTQGMRFAHAMCASCKGRLSVYYRSASIWLSASMIDLLMRAAWVVKRATF